MKYSGLRANARAAKIIISFVTIFCRARNDGYGSFCGNAPSGDAAVAPAGSWVVWVCGGL